MQEANKSDLSDTMRSAINNFIVEFLDTFLTLTHEDESGANWPKAWHTYHPQEKLEIVEIVRIQHQEQRDRTGLSSRDCPDCELADVLSPEYKQLRKDLSQKMEANGE